MTTPIIGPLPANILAGQPVTAAPVMADFNWIVSQVNANVTAPTVPVFGKVMAQGIGATVFVSSVPMVIGSAANLGTVTTVNLNTLSEFSATTGLFTASQAGVYQMMVSAMGIPNATTWSFEPFISIRQNGTVITQPIFFTDTIGAFDTFVGVTFAVALLGIGDTLSATATATFTGFAPALQYFNLSVIGVGT